MYVHDVLSILRTENGSVKRDTHSPVVIDEHPTTIVNALCRVYYYLLTAAHDVSHKRTGFGYNVRVI